MNIPRSLSKARPHSSIDCRSNRTNGQWPFEPCKSRRYLGEELAWQPSRIASQRPVVCSMLARVEHTQCSIESEAADGVSIQPIGDGATRAQSTGRNAIRPFQSPCTSGTCRFHSSCCRFCEYRRKALAEQSPQLPARAQGVSGSRDLCRHISSTCPSPDSLCILASRRLPYVRSFGRSMSYPDLPQPPGPRSCAQWTAQTRSLVDNCG